LQCLSALMGPRSVKTAYDVRDLVVRWNKPEATIFDYGLAEPTGSAMRVVSAGRRRSLLLGGERTRGDRPEPQAANLTVEA